MLEIPIFFYDGVWTRGDRHNIVVTGLVNCTGIMQPYGMPGEYVLEIDNCVIGRYRGCWRYYDNKERRLRVSRPHQVQPGIGEFTTRFRFEVLALVDRMETENAIST